jgi:hypothetical protein
VLYYLDGEDALDEVDTIDVVDEMIEVVGIDLYLYHPVTVERY